MAKTFREIGFAVPRQISSITYNGILVPCSEGEYFDPLE